jgi:hypothetical protein
MVGMAGVPSQVQSFWTISLVVELSPSLQVSPMIQQLPSSDVAFEL